MDLSDVTESDLGLLPYADLPLGALKRTKGGLDNELAISVNFGITRDPKGLKALEFISWWVRDSARAGEPMQIRCVALPPIGDQFGTSLRFCIDYFYADPEQDIGKLLSKVGSWPLSSTAQRAYTPRSFRPDNAFKPNLPLRMSSRSC